MPYGVRLQMPRESNASYIVECKHNKRKFRSDKAEALGVPRGKLRGKLVDGETIEIDGRTICPDDVLEPPTPAPIIGIIDIPTIDYLYTDLGETISQYFAQHNEFLHLLHLSPSNVLLHPNYQSFLGIFPDYTKHIVFDKNLTGNFENTMKSPILKHSDILLTELNAVCPKQFKVATNMYHQINPEIEQNIKNSFRNLVIPEIGLKMILSPEEFKGDFDNSDCLKPINYQEIISRVDSLEFPPFLTLNRISYEDFIDTSQANSDPAILLLGTASMRPGKYRNVSSIWVGEYGSSFLFDCGEGTYSQMCRHFGENIDQALIDLKVIFISHMHADHHLGSIKILHERSKLTSEPLIIVAPKTYR